MAADTGGGPERILAAALSAPAPRCRLLSQKKRWSGKKLLAAKLAGPAAALLAPRGFPVFHSEHATQPRPRWWRAWIGSSSLALGRGSALPAWRSGVGQRQPRPASGKRENRALAERC